MVVTFFASLLIYFMFLGLVVLWYIDGKIKKEQVAHALLACFIAFILAVVIKYFFPTIRPFMVNGLDTGVIINPTSAAFPSEHTVIAFALAVTVFLHDRKVGWWFLVSALVIGLARVLANVHYPIDILGGALLGTLTAVVVDKIHLLDLVKTLSPRRRLLPRKIKKNDYY